MLKRVLTTLLVIISALLVIIAIMAVVSYEKLPDNASRSKSTYLPADPENPLAKRLLTELNKHPNRSGNYLLDNSHDAFLARLAVAASAKNSLDVQYYTWHDDTTGHLLFQSLYQAAQRGVRVRLLLDDNNTDGMDDILSSFNAHPNIEVRLFNPFMQRNFRALGYLNDFFRLNRRMHNKTFTADGIVTIAGGRNVGDEYFGFGTGVMFADLDLLSFGPAANAVEKDFDKYWASESAYPIERIVNNSDPEVFDPKPLEDEDTRRYLAELSRSPFVDKLRKGTLDLVWTETTLISDDPAKVIKRAKNSRSLLSDIIPMMEDTNEALLVISPYFVPTKQGKRLFSKLAQQGKQVIVLTNSLAATDVVPVHSGYAKYRKPLLNAGVSLYELKPMATIITKSRGGMINSSGASLHAKTFIVDNKTLFIGSFNIDPRSAALNTEMGFIFDSPEMARYLSTNMQENQMQYSYEVSLTPQGKLHWITEEDNQIIEYNNEPESSLWSRIGVWICSLLPIEWLL